AGSCTGPPRPRRPMRDAMNGRLLALLDATWQHALPLGPFGDFDQRQRAEREWEESLSADDCLALLGWVERPQRPAHWALYLDRWVGAMPIHAARHVGRAGRRLGDPRITRRLVELLGVVECRGLALDALGEVGDPTAFDALFDCLGDPEHRFEVLL